MARPRAVAIHIPVHSWAVDEVISKAISFGEKVFSCLKSSGMVDVWTKRFVLPPIPEKAFGYRDVEVVAKEISSSFGDRVIVAFPIEPTSQVMKEIHKVSSVESAYFSTVCIDGECIKHVINSVYAKTREVEINFFTRFAISFGMWVETPYFPATANTSNVLGFSASLRYVDIVSQALLQNNLQLLRDFLLNVNKKLEDTAKCSNIPFLGIDYSLSPWIEKDESIASLVESLTGSAIGSPGTLNTIYALNTFLRGLVRRMGLRHIGFNEVMLPVAEDSLLNLRVKEGLIRVRDLISYSFTCVAGLDMVALPKNANIYGVALDMLTVYRVKNKVVAMRIIPTDFDELSEVVLKNFGKTYVAKL
ncbi:DUF711 family protein [Ignisphaera sp. 4213-co]|uniref:DUF711 family protein n=1 Tax=Ignisphaera cupida TaxID=3050454 RepID=A0ABD4Z8Z0_9CREN|nr:DUF711 family protein [Ignisphaera sp. 4213-co]MDK6028750.1 DUF711 family protein [Ignisphaera sp. 4213-co]